MPLWANNDLDLSFAYALKKKLLNLIYYTHVIIDYFSSIKYQKQFEINSHLSGWKLQIFCILVLFTIYSIIIIKSLFYDVSANEAISSVKERKEVCGWILLFKGHDGVSGGH